MEVAADLPNTQGLSLPGGGGADLSALVVFDDPQSWDDFGRPVESDSPGLPDLWESQVVVRGMHCAACSLTLEQSLLGVKGVREAHVSAASGRASITWSSAETRPSQWMWAPRALGYELSPAADAISRDAVRQEARLVLWRWLVAGFCMMQVMMYAAPGYFSAPGDITPDIAKLLRWASWLLSLPVLLFSCRPFFANALRDLRHRSMSMDLPVALGIAVTFAVSSAATFEPQGWWGQEVYFDSLTMFVFFLLSGRWLEQRLRARTAGSLDVLSQRLPDSVERLSPDGRFERVASRSLKLDDIVRVLPGDAFPSDGTIILGSTFTDEAILTGESTAVARAAGAQVMAGSYNLTAAVQVRVERLGNATLYSQIVALMARASVDKPRLAMLADKVALPFLWFVLVAAAGAAAFWWSEDPARALMAAVAVLVVTCPCALSLATPAAMLSSAGLLARHGVLVRKLQAMEALAAVDTVIFDKTGTLTQTGMGLLDVQVCEGITASDALQLAARLARHSLHPVSRALVDAAVKQGQVINPELADVCEHVGKGLECRAPQAGHNFLRLGTADFCGVESRPGNGLQTYLSDETGWLATFGLGEVLRDDAAEAVVMLQERGIDVHLLSGDQPGAVKRMGVQLGIAHWQGGCTPATKLAHLQTLQRQGRNVLMVGDGLNDGPVLAGAHASIAVGMAVPLSRAQCDFVIPGGQLRIVPAMLVHARFTMQVVRQNLCWAAAYNAVCVPLALSGWLPAWLAGLGMALSSLLVVTNSARLSRFRRGEV